MINNSAENRIVLKFYETARISRACSYLRAYFYICKNDWLLFIFWKVIPVSWNANDIQEHRMRKLIYLARFFQGLSVFIRFVTLTIFSISINICTSYE